MDTSTEVIPYVVPCFLYVMFFKIKESIRKRKDFYYGKSEKERGEYLRILIRDKNERFLRRTIHDSGV